MIEMEQVFQSDGTSRTCDDSELLLENAEIVIRHCFEHDLIEMKDQRTANSMGQNKLNPDREEKGKDLNRPEYIFRLKINLEKSR